MGATRIEWADVVWNPVSGCAPVSEGCRNCYARRMAYRLRGRCGYPEAEPFAVTLHPDRLKQPLRWRKPRRVFVCSMGDLFHEKVPESYVDEILEIIAACPQHTFLVLTKRPQNIERKLYEVTEETPIHELGGGDYLPNLWLGVTVEHQEAAEQRIPILLEMPAAVRWVSCEPLLGPVDLSKWLRGHARYDTDRNGRPIPQPCGSVTPRLDWVVIGGETGPQARPMDPAWARAIRDQCRAAGVPLFLKQMSKRARIPPDLMVREFPTSAMCPQFVRKTSATCPEQSREVSRGIGNLSSAKPTRRGTWSER